MQIHKQHYDCRGWGGLRLARHSGPVVGERSDSVESEAFSIPPPGSQEAAQQRHPLSCTCRVPRFPESFRQS